MPGPLISSGLHDTILVTGTPAVTSAGKAMTLSSTMTSGLVRAMISARRGWQYSTPSIRPCQIGLITVSSCSIVGLRNSGAVSRTKSFQYWPGSLLSGVSSGGARSTRSSSKPSAASFPLQDASAANTTRCPRLRRTSPIPTQLFVGP